MVAALGAALLALGAALTLVVAPAQAKDDAAGAEYVTILWRMDNYPATNAIWPQTLVAYVKTTSPQLGAFDGRLNEKCVGYQIDVYRYRTESDRAKVDHLIEHGHLYGPNNPPEPLIAGGAGTAWKIYKNNDKCTKPTPPPTTPPVTPTSPPPTTPTSPATTPPVTPTSPPVTPPTTPPVTTPPVTTPPATPTTPTGPATTPPATPTTPTGPATTPPVTPTSPGTTPPTGGGTTPPGQLPQTGGEGSGPLLIGGLLALAAGTGVLLIARRPKGLHR